MRLDLADPLRDELRLDRLAVDVLHLPRCDVTREGGDPLKLSVGVFVAAKDTFEVEHGEPAELAHEACRLRGDDAVESGGEQRQVEAVRPERPADIDVVGVTGTPRRDDRNVVESVGAARLFAASNLYFH